MSLYILILLIFVSFSNANNCIICDCGYELNIVYCYGYEVSTWPMIYPNGWVHDIFHKNKDIIATSIE